MMATIVEVRRVIVYRGERKWINQCLFHSALQMGKPLVAGKADDGEANTVTLISEDQKVISQGGQDFETADEVPQHGA